MSLEKKVVILGAGISGLALGWFFKQKFGNRIKITILEKSERAGGLIKTVHKNGFLFEQGPHSCRSAGNGKITLKLAQDLGISNQIITPAPQAVKRFIAKNDRLYELPTTLRSFVGSPWAWSILPRLILEWFKKPVANDDESIYDFINRRFGRKIAEDLIDPLVTGIYAGDIKKLSIRSCFPFWYQWEKKYGSVVHGCYAANNRTKSTEGSLEKSVEKAGLFSFKDGMETLTQSLAKELQKELKLGNQAIGLYNWTHGVEVFSSSGEIFHADLVVSALPAAAMADLIAPHNTTLGALLTSIESTSVAMVHLGYKKSVLKQNGFGYLVPSKYHKDVLGAVWSSSVFPQQNTQPEETRLTVFVGGVHHPQACWRRDTDLIQMAERSARDLLQIPFSPDEVMISRNYKAIPQYNVGHSKKLIHLSELLQEHYPRIGLIGCAFGGVSVNDCIAQAELTAKNYGAFLLEESPKKT